VRDLTHDGSWNTFDENVLQLARWAALPAQCSMHTGRRVKNYLERPPSYSSSSLSFIEGVHIGARALHVLNLIWFGYIARLSQWGGGGGVISSFK
jgi:hypothetical protein